MGFSASESRWEESNCTVLAYGAGNPYMSDFRVCGLWGVIPDVPEVARTMPERCPNEAANPLKVNAVRRGQKWEDLQAGDTRAQYGPSGS